MPGEELGDRTTDPVCATAGDDRDAAVEQSVPVVDTRDTVEPPIASDLSRPVRIRRATSLTADPISLVPDGPRGAQNGRAMQKELAMKANVGDWLVVKGRTTEHSDQRGLITEVHTADGSPPYVVRWLATGDVATVVPGPDAIVLTPERTGSSGAGTRHRSRTPRCRVVGAASRESVAIAALNRALCDILCGWPRGCPLPGS